MLGLGAAILVTLYVHNSGSSSTPSLSLSKSVASVFIAGTWVYTIMYATDQTRRCTGYAVKPAVWPGSNPSWDCAPNSNGQLFPDHSPGRDGPNAGAAYWKDPGPDLGYYCQERPHAAAYDTLRSMASVGVDGNPRFYYQPVSGDLTDLFKRIAADLSSTRLLPG